MSVLSERKVIKTPKACILLLTLTCNLRCKMCGLWSNDESKLIRPTLKDWMNIIESFVRFSGPDINIIFGGGEPLLFPDMLMKLIAFCKNNRIRTSLATSAYLLDKQIAEDLVSSGLDYIALTLYSLNEKTHNLLRGMPDSHQKVLKAIEYLSEYQNHPEIAIDTVIMDPNIDELLDLARWVIQDKRIRSIFFQSVVQPFHTAPKENWFESQEYKFLWPKDMRKVDFVLDGLIKMKESSLETKHKINNSLSQLELFKSYFKAPNNFIKKFSCNVTNGEAFTISPNGDLNICPYLEPIGNIIGNDLEKIWHSQKADLLRDEISRCKKNCHHIINCWYEE